MRRVFLDSFKYCLTRIGACISPRALIEIQALVNYLRVGRWMRDHDFFFERRVSSREEVWQVILDQVRSEKVLYLEFGVAYGESIKHWARELKHPDAMLHGFDSFEGLPEEAGPWKKGQFSSGGCVPNIPDPRVRFFRGWFDRSLPSYSLPPHDVLMINMDADLYSSTVFVLRCLRPYIKKGTFIYFDEMNHVEHEPHAFDDFLRESGCKFKPICADKTLAFVAFECVEPASLGVEPIPVESS
jgi:O-methyltransferase